MAVCLLGFGKCTMMTGPSFREYLVSKKIDADAFKHSEPEVWNAWEVEFEQIHPNSFTVQKLNLINLVRRKYLLKSTPDPKPTEPLSPNATPAPSKPGRPLMRPKTKPD